MFFAIEKVSDANSSDSSRVPIELARHAVYEEDGRLLLNVSLYFEVNPTAKLYWNMEKNICNYIFTKESVLNYCLTHADAVLGEDNLDNNRLKTVLADVLGAVDEDTFFVARAGAQRGTAVLLAYQVDEIHGPYNIYLEIPYRSELNEMINYLTPQDLLSRTTFRSYFEAGGEKAVRMRRNSVDMLAKTDKRRDTQLQSGLRREPSQQQDATDIEAADITVSGMESESSVSGSSEEREIRIVQDSLTAQHINKGYAKNVMTRFKLFLIFLLGLSSAVDSIMFLLFVIPPRGTVKSADVILSVCLYVCLSACASVRLCGSIVVRQIAAVIIVIGWYITRSILYGMGAIASFITFVSAESLYSFVKFCTKWFNKLLLDPLFNVVPHLNITAVLTSLPAWFQPSYNNGDKKSPGKSKCKPRTGTESEDASLESNGNTKPIPSGRCNNASEQELTTQSTITRHASRERSLRSIVTYSPFSLFGGKGNGRGSLGSYGCSSNGGNNSDNFNGRGRGRSLQRDTRRIHAAEDDIPAADAAVCHDDDGTTETSELHNMV